MRRGIRKLTAWLVLVLCFCSSLAPTQALVLCLEADGTAVLERTGLCDGCPGTGVDRDSEVGSAVEGAGCPCIDIPLPRSGDEPEVGQKRPEPSSDGAAAPPASPVGLPTAGQDPRTLASLSRARPRSAPQLALIRTVILRI